MIQSLWVGKRLSTMEILSIRSFLHHGHDYHLYVYEPIANLPEGAVARDAREILPESRIFRYKESGSLAGFSNFFRYKLLLERGGWWVDTDVICLRPFEFPAAYVFASEMIQSGPAAQRIPVAASAVLKAPAGSEVMAYAWEVCAAKDPALLAWGETGPRLVAELVHKFSLANCLHPPEVFCPLSCHDWQHVLEPARVLPLSQTSVSLHLWNEMWRDEGRDKDAAYPADCPYTQLQQQYLCPATTQ